MANEAGTDMSSVWKNQSAVPPAISFEQLRRKSQKLEKRVLWRNLQEYLASIIVIAAFGYYISLFHSTLVRIGCGLVIAGTLFVVYTLHKRGSARIAPADMAFLTCVDFHRHELERQRDLLLSVWSWYLLPFVPGMVVFLIGLFAMIMQQPNAAAHPGRVIAGLSITAIGCAAAFIAIWKLNQWAARKLQREIDVLDSLKRES